MKLRFLKKVVKRDYVTRRKNAIENRDCKFAHSWDLYQHCSDVCEDILPEWLKNIKIKYNPKFEMWCHCENRGWYVWGSAFSYSSGMRYIAETVKKHPNLFDEWTVLPTPRYNTWREVKRFTFNKEQLADIQSATIVPSVWGKSMCFVITNPSLFKYPVYGITKHQKMFFIPLDNDVEFPEWTHVDPVLITIKVLGKRGEYSIQRVTI